MLENRSAAEVGAGAGAEVEGALVVVAG